MYSWNTLRNICAVLLLIPVVHLAYLVSRETLALLDTSPEVWREEVEAYAAERPLEAWPEQPLVVVGGRLVKLWPGLEQILAPRPVLMRGVGDATVNDLHHHYQQLIGFYRPGAVVLLPGNGEFHIRDSKSATELVRAVQELEALDASHGFSRHFYLFSPIKTILTPGDHAIIDEVNEQLSGWAAGAQRVTLLDPNPLLAGPDGSPGPAFFRSDGIHLNEHGFLRLSLLLRQTLDAAGEEPAEVAAAP